MSDDLDRFLEAVARMRAAQKLELAALPSNLKIWRAAREKRSIAQLEQEVDRLVEELLARAGRH